MAIESKKIFKHETKCAGVGCPLKDTCKLFLADPEQSRNIIRAPYVRKNGKFVKCDSYG